MKINSCFGSDRNRYRLYRPCTVGIGSVHPVQLCTVSLNVQNYPVTNIHGPPVVPQIPYEVRARTSIGFCGSCAPRHAVCQRDNFTRFCSPFVISSQRRSCLLSQCGNAGGISSSKNQKSSQQNFEQSHPYFLIYAYYRLLNPRQWRIRRAGRWGVRILCPFPV